VNGYRQLEGASYVQDQAAHCIFDPEEEGTIIFRKVGDFHQSTWDDIQENLNLPKHHSDKLKSQKCLGVFIVFNVGLTSI
jgi:hypothetical protein